MSTPFAGHTGRNNRTQVCVLAAFLAALCMLCGSGPAQADPKDWPAFWRGRFDAQTVALLDNAYEHFRNEKPDKVLYEQAAISLEAKLHALQSTKSRTEQLRRGRAWMFLGELLAGQDRTAAGASAEAQGLTLIESASRNPTLELAETLRSHGITWLLLDKPDRATVLIQRSIAVFDQSGVPDNDKQAASLLNLADLYYKAGKPQLALPLLNRARPLAEKLFGADRIESSLMLGLTGLVYVSLHQDATALPYLERALAILDKLGAPDNANTAQLAGQIGAIRLAADQYDLALPPLQRSLAIREKIDGAEHRNTARALRELGRLYQSMGRYADALPLFQRTLAIREKTQGAEDAATSTALLDLSMLYRDLGQNSAALPLAQRSLAIREKVRGAEHADTATSLSGLGNLYMAMGQYQAALPLLKRSLAIYEHVSGARHANTANALTNLGQLYQNMGMYGAALPLLQRSLEIRQIVYGAEHSETAQSLNDLAVLLHAMGQLAMALPLFEHSLAIREKVDGPDHPETAMALNSLAAIHHAMGNTSLAAPLYDRALGIFMKVDGPLYLNAASVANNIGTLYARLGLYADALPVFQRCLAIREKSLGHEHPETARVLTNLAAVYLLTGQNDLALPLLQRAERIANRAGNGEIVWQSQTVLASAYGRANHPELAVFWGKQAINTIQSMRAGLGSLDRDTQRSFLRDKRQVYTGVADLLITQGRIPEAQTVMQMLKEEEYFDFIRRETTAGDVRSTQLPLTGLERKANEAYYRVRDRLSALGTEKDAIVRRQETGAASQADLQRLDAIDQDLALANTAFDDFVAGLDRLLKSDKNTASTADQVRDQIKGAANLLANMRAAGRGAAVVQYIVSQERLHIILTTEAVQIPREVAITPPELNKLIASFRDAVQNPGVDPRPLGQKLYATLIEPVRADLEAQHIDTLMLVLDSSLRYLPFAALTRDNRYLIEDYRLAIYTEASKSGLALPPSRPWQVVALGITHALPGFDALPSVRTELEGIVRPDVLPGVMRLDEQFTLASLKGALHSPVLHIASHFSFVPGSDQSFLLLGNGDHLTLGDVRKSYRFEVDLLTLSACNTATGGGQRENGSEVEGLGMLAQEQGASAVMASLWAVADSSTGLLMQQFYRVRQQKGVNKAEALRAAQLSLLHGTAAAAASQQSDSGRGAARQPAAANEAALKFALDPAAPYAHPYFWAPFVLMGNFL